MALFELFTLGFMYMAKGWVTFQKRRKLSKLFIAISSFVGLCALAGSGVEIWTYSSGNAFLHTPCHALPNLTKYTINKDPVSQYSWRYFVPNTQVIVQQKCPSPNNEPTVLFGPISSSQLVARANKQQLSLYNNVQILDCNGNIIFTIESNSVQSTILNNFGLTSNVLFRGADNSLIAYSTGTTLYVSDINIYDYVNTSNLVARIHQYSGTSWMWDITRYDVNHKAADNRLLLLLAGLISFQDPLFGANDICNNLFYYMGYSILGLVIVCVVALCTGLIRIHIIKKAERAERAERGKDKEKDKEKEIGKDKDKEKDKEKEIGKDKDKDDLEDVVWSDDEQDKKVIKDKKDKKVIKDKKDIKDIKVIKDKKETIEIGSITSPAPSLTRSLVRATSQPDVLGRTPQPKNKIKKDNKKDNKKDSKQDSSLAAI